MKFLFLIAAALAVSGCSSSPPYRTGLYAGKSVYSEKNILEKVSKFGEIDTFSKIETSRAGGLRDEIFKDLLRRAAKEKLNTKEIEDMFKTLETPGASSKSLPARLETVRFEGKNCWLLVESWGMPKDKNLKRVRFWVFEEKTLDLVYAHAFVPQE